MERWVQLKVDVSEIDGKPNSISAGGYRFTRETGWDGLVEAIASRASSSNSATQASAEAASVLGRLGGPKGGSKKGPTKARPSRSCAMASMIRWKNKDGGSLVVVENFGMRWLCCTGTLMDTWIKHVREAPFEDVVVRKCRLKSKGRMRLGLNAKSPHGDKASSVACAVRVGVAVPSEVDRFQLEAAMRQIGW